MKSLELKWGIIIGLAGMIWLYLSYYLGMRSNGIDLVQAVWLIGGVISLVGYIVGLRAIKKQEPELEYLEGVRSGAIIASIVAFFAVITHIGYLKVIDPGWPDYITGQVQAHFENIAFSTEQLEEIRDGYSLGATLRNSALGTVIVGVIFTAVIMLFLRKRRR